MRVKSDRGERLVVIGLFTIFALTIFMAVLIVLTILSGNLHNGLPYETTNVSRVNKEREYVSTRVDNHEDHRTDQQPLRLRLQESVSEEPADE